MTENVLPEPTAGSALLRVQASSKLAFGATTAALVTLASGGTAVLVSHGTGSIASPTSLPGVAQVPDASDAPLVVERAAGSYDTARTPTPAADRTVTALLDALGQRPEPGRRTLLAPLVDLTGSQPPIVAAPPAAPVAEPDPAPKTPRRPADADRPHGGGVVRADDDPRAVPRADRPGHVADRDDKHAKGKKAGKGPGKHALTGKAKHGRGRHTR